MVLLLGMVFENSEEIFYLFLQLIFVWNGFSYLDTVFYLNRNELLIEKIKEKVDTIEKEAL
jgi:hypothetical protein